MNVPWSWQRVIVTSQSAQRRTKPRCVDSRSQMKTVCRSGSQLIGACGPDQLTWPNFKKILLCVQKLAPVTGY